LGSAERGIIVAALGWNSREEETKKKTEQRRLSGEEDPGKR
jgi:hypothetical protein